MFYTGVNNNVWGIGLTISTVKNDITSIKGYKSSLEVPINYTAKDLYDIIANLEYRLSMLEGNTSILPTPTPTPVQSITLNKNISTLTVGQTEQLSVIFTPTNPSNKNITWSASNSNCTVVNGLVTAKVSGECVITAISEDGSKTATCTYSINDREIGNNLLENIVWNNGYIDGNTGEIVTNTIDVYSDYINVNGYKVCRVYANDITTDTGSDSNKIICYTSDKTLIKFISANVKNVMGELPEGTEYIRISFRKDSNIYLQLNNVNNIFNTTNSTQGKYFDSLDGTEQSKADVAHTDYLTITSNDIIAIKGIISGAFFNINKGYLKGINYDENGKLQFINSEESNYIGLNFKFAETGQYCYSIKTVGSATIS